MEKRGQITLFVIIGIVVLFASTLVFLYTGAAKQEVAPKPPQEIEPVVQYVQYCLEDSGKRAVTALGQQGGYIYFPDTINSNPWSYVELIPDSGIKLPYWYYRGQNRFPSLQKMEEDINRFVVDNVERCVGDFSSFNEFKVEKSGALSASTQLVDKDTVIKLEFPIKVTSLADNTVTEFSQYITHVPARVKTAYELARKIQEKENEAKFLETSVINLMVLDPDIPFGDMRLQCSRLRWQVSDVNNDLKEMLVMNMPRMRVKGTNLASKPFERPIKEYEKFNSWDKFEVKDLENKNLPDNIPPGMYEYKHLFFDLGIEQKDMEVNFQYNQEWPVDMRVRPSRGDIMDARYGKGNNKFLNFLCINVYHFTYDLNFPVEVIVNDPLSFGGEGYNFRFITPVLIDHNTPNRKSELVYDLIPRDVDLEFCGNYGTKQVEVRALNSYSREELRDVNVSFECGRYTCPYGAIELEGIRYQKTITLPQGCAPGSIVGEKKRYMEKREYIPENDNRVVLYMNELVPLKLNFARHKSDDIDKPLSLADNQRVVLSVYDAVEDYSVYKNIDMSEQQNIESVELPLKNANYELNIMLTEKTGDDIIQVGGYRAANWTITDDDIASAKEITFHLYEIVPKPKNEKDAIALYSALEDNSIKQKLAPSVRG